MAYRHTQHGKLHLVLLSSALLCLTIGILTTEAPAAVGITLAVAILLVGLSFCFKTLTVQDDGDALLARFGPVGLFRKRFAYDQIRDPEPGRTNLLHGWGIHGFPGRWQACNLWGFDCVRFRYRGVRIYLGTDDPEGLAAFLQDRPAAGEPNSGKQRSSSSRVGPGQQK